MSMSASQLNLFDTTVLSGELAALWSLEDDQPIPEVSLLSPPLRPSASRSGIFV
ncbi:hypothetical protein NBRC3222_2669 [Acetobacter pasteurianus NBRC 3222]|nr:hypothetical protein NBRC3222_2669 [Acetobacter pasteurianus NBRC 3222]